MTLNIVTAYDLTATVDQQTRTIEGLAVPYGISGMPGGANLPVIFAEGSFTRSLNGRADRVRLIIDHDRTRPVGRLVEFTETPQGLFTRWKVAQTAAGDQVLAEAAEGVRDGLSVGAQVLKHSRQGDNLVVNEAKLVEVSLVAFPAYDSARVSTVAATQNISGRDPRILRLMLNMEKIK